MVEKNAEIGKNETKKTEKKKKADDEPRLAQLTISTVCLFVA
jgi:hypothetical protein